MTTALRVGSVIRERWRIDARIGHGAASIVWSATHRNGDRVAIKVLKPELANEKTIRARFLREAYVANNVGHPGVVRVIDDDVAPDGSPLLVMDLLEGKTLEQRREDQGGKLPVEEVVVRIADLLAILEAAHGKGIVHRDIKPENVFIDSADRVRVLDFGIARVFDGASETTRTGVLMGTPQFMAPEQAAGKMSEIDARTDLYAVGATAFTLTTGEPVHDARSLPEMLNAVMGRHARSIRTLAPHVPTEVAAAIDRALLRDRNARWPSAVAMREALLAALPSARARVAVARPEDVAPETVPTSSEGPGKAQTERIPGVARTLESAGFDEAKTLERPRAYADGETTRERPAVPPARDRTEAMANRPVIQAVAPTPTPSGPPGPPVQAPPRLEGSNRKLAVAVVALVGAIAVVFALLAWLR